MSGVRFLLRPGFAGRLRAYFWRIFLLPRDIWSLRDIVIFQTAKLLRDTHPNKLNKHGMKCFSQTDEDGITLEILRRIGCQDNGTYVEFGVGDGLENNTLILAALGWKGVWVGGEELAFDVKPRESPIFSYVRAWITLENIVSLAKRGLEDIRSSRFDVASLDLDGNDLYFVEELLKNELRPKLFIVEYNAKFPPPVQFSVAYDPNHRWESDDYFGASLMSFDILFRKFGYRLVCCNSQTGSNAFFIDNKYDEFFADVPREIGNIYAEPRYHLYHLYGHRPSTKVVSQIFNRP